MLVLLLDPPGNVYRSIPDQWSMMGVHNLGPVVWISGGPTHAQKSPKRAVLDAKDRRLI